MCCVTSTSATARSRVACSTERPSVQTRITSPVVAALRCHRTMAQASRRHRQHHRDEGVHDAQPLQVEQAAPAGGHLLLDLGVEAPVLAEQAAERLHDRHVADDVRHLAVDRCRAIGELVMQRLAGGGAAEHDEDDQPGDDDQARRHAPAHGGHEGDRANRRHAGRQHVPHQHVLDGEERVGRRRDAARKRAWGAAGEIAGRVSREMAEEVAAHVARDGHERRVADPARQAPQADCRRR